jgi:hypothetical protein
MNREVHVRFWERAEVKFLRATRQLHALPHDSIGSRFTSMSGPANSRVLVTLRAAWPFSRYAAATLAPSKGRLIR